MDQATQPLDLTACDKEPIHIPGSIQPHGLLLTVDIETGAFLQIAGDSKAFLAIDAADLLGQSIETVFEPETVRLLMSLWADMVEPLYLGSFPAPDTPGDKLDLTAHVNNGVVLLELEHSSRRPESSPELLGNIRRVIVAWEAAKKLGDLLVEASRQFRALTGYDRVMIYRFLENDTGVVVSEDKLDSLDALLNHHYPASDIPKQARVLYLKSPIRLIADVEAVPAKLVPALCHKTGQALDMSHCSLRSVSPIHIQFLKNMGVTASMSVSIVVDGRLWGLVSCHHMAPRALHYEMRETCKLLGQVLELLNKTEELKQEALDRIDVLRKREAELGTFLEITSDAYIRMDEGGIVIAWNRKAEEVSLWSRNEAIGSPLETLIIPPAMVSAYQEGIKRYLADGDSKVVDNVTESVLRRKDGFLIPVEIRVTAIAGRAGRCADRTGESACHVQFSQGSARTKAYVR